MLQYEVFDGWTAIAQPVQGLRDDAGQTVESWSTAITTFCTW
jgi:hypothetical protein